MHIKTLPSWLSSKLSRSIKYLLLALFLSVTLLLAYTLHDGFRSQVITLWFNLGAFETYQPEDLHKKSQWKYLSEQEFDEVIMDTVSSLKPPLKNHAKVFDIGMGVGAAFKVLQNHYPNLKLAGSDISSTAINHAKDIFPKFKDQFHVHDMTIKHEWIKDNTFDHVFSFGALAMYLTQEKMLIAIEEAIRITKPGGSLAFTHFIEPNAQPRRSIVAPIPKAFWFEALPQMGVSNIRIQTMPHEGERYQVLCTKNKKGH
jgi:ubiquinone/menaquinone biosynthesis C-methylase UbiE